MKLSTLLVVGALVVGGLYVARNAHTWMNDLHRKKAHVTAALRKRFEDEKAHVTAQLKKGLDREEANVRAELKKRLAREKARAAAALKKRRDRERARAADARRAAESHIPSVSAPDSPLTENAVTGMTEAAFWRLMSGTRSAAGNDTGKQSELLKERLTQLSPAAIIEFARVRHRLDEAAYTWNLWGAAQVIEDGCSDDCFRNFRGYLISLGEGPYVNALSNPDSLASVVQDAETGNWENAADVAPDAYSSVTGGDFPLADSDVSGSPRGTPFNEDDAAGLVRRYPRLAARFR
jgi:Protein of unknown function (DUF4240)